MLFKPLPPQVQLVMLAAFAIAWLVSDIVEGDLSWMSFFALLVALYLLRPRIPPPDLQ